VRLRLTLKIFFRLNKCSVDIFSCGETYLSRTIVALYAGIGATLFSDVSGALLALGIQHDFLDGLEIQRGDLRSYKTLVFPGGITDICYQALSPKAKAEIKTFVEKGGGYVGICMGAYIASKLMMVRSRAIRRWGEYWAEVEIVNPQHQVVKGYSGKITMYYQNGPEILTAESEESLAKFPNGAAAILSAKHGSGKTVLFSPHPEKLPSTTMLLKNAVEYCCSID